jgi:hypothetical protein
MISKHDIDYGPKYEMPYTTYIYQLDTCQTPSHNLNKQIDTK